MDKINQEDTTAVRKATTSSFIDTWLCRGCHGMEEMGVKITHKQVLEITNSAKNCG